MGSVRHQRERLPRHVYWVRRGVVLAVALLLVFGIGKLVGGTGTDSTGSGIKANTSSAEQTPRASVSLGPVAPSIKVRSRIKVPLMPASGPCSDDEVSVLPSVPHAWAGTSITIRLAITGTQPACTFEVSPESLVVKLASGSDRIWSSQDCPKAIATTQVVVRSGQPVEVPVVWSGRRSGDDCAPGDWALPGFYHVYAAALGSTPTDVQFEVTLAPALRVTRTPKPRPSASDDPSAKSSARVSTPTKAKPTQRP